jgi:murein L,D-transpeptidase YafK
MRERVGRAIGAVALVMLAACMRTPSPPLAPPERPPVDQVLVEKAKRRLTLLRDGHVVHEYRVALGRHPAGAKRAEGDGRTPEGRYWIDWRNPDSKYHRSLHVSYPDETDRARAAAVGVEPGGEIMIHGLPNGAASIGRAHRLHDWTEGCIAVTNEEIDEIWGLVPDGTPIEIRP